MLGREVREPVRGGLVRDRVRVAEVFDRDRAPLLGVAQHRHRMLFGDEERAGEVVGLDALAQELGVRPRLAVPEDAARERLQHRGARIALHRHRAREVQPAVPDVGDGACGCRQVGHVVQRKSQVGGDIRRRALGERTPRVVDGAQDRPRVLLEVGEVVVLPPHEVTELHVRPTRLLGGRRPLVTEALDLALQREQGAERLVGHRLSDAERFDAERAEGLPLHRALEGDLERRAFVEGLGLEQLVDGRAECARDRAEQGELRLALAGLDHRQLTGRPLDRGGELIEGHAASGPQLTDPASDRQGVRVSRGIHRGVRRGGGGRKIDVRHVPKCVTNAEEASIFTAQLVTEAPNLHPEWCHQPPRHGSHTASRPRGIRHERQGHDSDRHGHRA